MSDHEIRIALVLNGGVSLAVWMGGVTHELDLIRRASAGGDAPSSQPYDEQLAQRWRDLCRRDGEQRKLVVDVIAGTSAGGLNGSLLATAVSHGSTLDPGDDNGPWLRQKWVGLGSLEVGKLVPAVGKPSTSVLDGDYFLTELKQLLKGVASGGQSAAAEPVTLFVTASGLGVQQFEAKDAAGQRFVVPDHRYLFCFTSEQRALYDGATRSFSVDPVNGLRDTKLLARAARASASFPVAFGPVLETPNMATNPPRLQPGAHTDSGAWLVDGGVLDNAPFGPVLDVVARRPVTGKASRYVLYVVPSAGIGLAATRLPEANEPGWQVAALSAVQFPREVDFRSDVEQLERLLLEADASWSDTQRLYDRCVHHPENRGALHKAAALLQPTYSRGRAAGGVWEAVTVASPDRSTVLDAATALSEREVDEILATDHPWVPDPDGSTALLREDADGNPCWPWGTGAAERVVRLVLRSLRTQIDTAAPGDRDVLEKWLKASSDALLKVLAVRDALAAELAVADLDLRPAGGAEAVAVGMNDIFEALQIQRALGDEFATLVAVVGPVMVETALEVEIVSRCTSARTPQQRSAPFQFLRLGPDIPLTLLDELPEGTIANDLKDRILYGTQVGHFGAFGAAEWRRWDWLMGRLHCVAHLGAMLGAEPDWIRETQRQVLAAEGPEGEWTVDKLAAQVRKLADDFSMDAGLRALTTMRDELNGSKAGRATTRGLADRLVDVSGGLSPQVGDWMKASAARKNEPRSWLLRTVRWFTKPARETLWSRLIRKPDLEAVRRPLVFEPWLPVAAAGVGVLLLVVAGVVGAAGVRIVAALLAGAVLALAAVLFVVSWYVRRARQQIRRWIAGKLPEISPSSRNR
jgi:predicted acylesterase/phospholipase RssA